MPGMRSKEQHNKGGNYHAKNQNKQSSSSASKRQVQETERNKAYKSHILTKIDKEKKKSQTVDNYRCNKRKEHEEGIACKKKSDRAYEMLSD